MLNQLQQLLLSSTSQRLTRRKLLQGCVAGLGGLTLADVLRLRAQGAVRPGASGKSVIAIYLMGGPSHIDMYDMKPDAPAEYRGEFMPVRTKVPGLEMCELMPLQAAIADKLAVVRGLQTAGFHSASELLSGRRPIKPSDMPIFPVFGSVVSKLRGNGGSIPPYVSLSNHANSGSPAKDPERPLFLGAAHKPFRINGQLTQDLVPQPTLSGQRLVERRGLLRAFDGLRRDVDNADQMLAGMDSYQQQALQLIASNPIRDALDVEQESPQVRERYGSGGLDFLRALRLAEAGVPVVTLAAPFTIPKSLSGPKSGGGIVNWDTHTYNFRYLRHRLPHYDRATAALITDLYERGLDRDVLVVLVGEMGRTPKIGDQTSCGRSHWPQAGCAVIAGGGLRMGQVIGETDRRAEAPRFRPYKAHHLLATIYHVLGIDPGATTLTDHRGRPHYLLDDAEKLDELL